MESMGVVVAYQCLLFKGTSENKPMIQRQKSYYSPCPSLLAVCFWTGSLMPRLHLAISYGQIPPLPGLGLHLRPGPQWGGVGPKTLSIYVIWEFSKYSFSNSAARKSPIQSPRFHLLSCPLPLHNLLSKRAKTIWSTIKVWQFTPNPMVNHILLDDSSCWHSAGYFNLKRLFWVHQGICPNWEGTLTVRIWNSKRKIMQLCIYNPSVMNFCLAPPA